MGDNLNDFKTYFEIFRQYSPEYNRDSESIILYSNDRQGVLHELKKHSIESTPVDKNKIEVDLESLSINTFWDDGELLEKISSHQFKKDNGVFNFINNRPRFYSSYYKNEYTNFRLTQTYFFSNIEVYLKFTDLLKKKGGDQSNEFQFIDHYNEDAKQFLLTSSKEPGKIVIRIPNKIPLLEEQHNFKNHFLLLQNAFHEGNKNFPVFLKNEIYGHLWRINENERLPFLFKNFNNIYAEAEKNFHVYLNDLSLDNIKKEYQEFKEKSFEHLSNILGKITNQIIALPLTVLAAVYAINRVSDSLEGIVLILVALIIVSAYLSSILKLFYNDVRVTEKSLNQEFKSLTKSDFFKKYIEEKSEFEEIKGRIKSRCGHLKIVLKSYFIIMHAFNIGLIFYSIIAYSGGSLLNGWAMLLPISYFIIWAISFFLVIFK